MTRNEAQITIAIISGIFLVIGALIGFFSNSSSIEQPKQEIVVQVDNSNNKSIREIEIHADKVTAIKDVDNLIIKEN
jgi:hypothetical protein